jgi:hypothetical protein
MALRMFRLVCLLSDRSQDKIMELAYNLFLTFLCVRSAAVVKTGQHYLSRENVCADFCTPNNFDFARAMMRSFRASDIAESFRHATSYCYTLPTGMNGTAKQEGNARHENWTGLEHHLLDDDSSELRRPFCSNDNQREREPAHSYSYIKRQLHLQVQP